MLGAETPPGWLKWAMARPGPEGGGEVLEKPKIKTRKPKLFHVILYNDDYTTMEFVVYVLQTVFQKGPAQAFRIMMDVHRRGRGVCGAYSYEIAETKVSQVMDHARKNQHPLQCIMEKK